MDTEAAVVVDTVEVDLALEAAVDSEVAQVSEVEAAVSKEDMAVDQASVEAADLVVDQASVEVEVDMAEVAVDTVEVDQVQEEAHPTEKVDTKR